MPTFLRARGSRRPLPFERGACSCCDGRGRKKRPPIVDYPGTAVFISALHLARVAAAHEPLRALIARYNDVLLAQVQRSAACNARHDAKQRLCRLLMQMRDLAQSDELPLTHEAASDQLGVRRTTITLAAGELKKSGLIAFRRGKVTIVDAEGLRAAACRCYAFVRDRTAML